MAALPHQGVHMAHFLEIGQALGYPVRTAKRAYKQAKKAELAYRKATG